MYTHSECPHQRKGWGGCPSLLGSTALPGCRRHGKSSPTMSLIPRATSGVPSKATAGQERLAAAASHCSLLSSRWGNRGTASEACEGWQQSPGWIGAVGGARFHPGMPAVGVTHHQNVALCGEEHGGGSMQLRAGHGGAFLHAESAGALLSGWH